MLAEHAADGGSDDKANAESGAHQTEICRTLVGRAYIGDIGIRGGIGGAGDAGKQAGDEQPRDRRRQRGDQIVDAQHGQRGDQDRSTPESIAQVADGGCTEKLHQGEHEVEPAAPKRGGAHALSGQFTDELRDYRDDDAEADGIDQHGDENKRQRVTAGR